MRFSPKEVLVWRHTNVYIPVIPKVCDHCGYTIWLGKMFRVGKKYHYCTHCCKTREEAFDLAFPQKITPQDIVMRREKEKIKNTFLDLVKDISSLPDGEVSPTIQSILLSKMGDITGNRY